MSLCSAIVIVVRGVRLSMVLYCVVCVSVVLCACYGLALVVGFVVLLPLAHNPVQPEVLHYIIAAVR